MEVALLFSLVIGLLIIGVPIAIALGMSSVLFLLVFSDSSLASIAQTLFSAFEGHYTLLAIPFFILASTFMTTGGVAKGSSGFQLHVWVTCQEVWQLLVFSHACYLQHCRVLHQQQ